jgi:hypothetical protein
MTITNQPTPAPKRGRTTSAPATRLPSTRERRPALAALAVLLIAGGAVLAGWLALRQSHTESYLYIKDTVSEGEQIQSADLNIVELPADKEAFIPSSQRDEVEGSFAQVDLQPGTVLTDNMIGAAPTLEPGRKLIGLSLEPGFSVQGLSTGDPVTVVLKNAGGGQAPVQFTTGVVRSVDKDDSGSLLVDVEIDSECAPDFAIGASDSQVVLASDAPDDQAVPCGTTSFEQVESDQPPRN